MTSTADIIEMIQDHDGTYRQTRLKRAQVSNRDRGIIQEPVGGFSLTSRDTSIVPGEVGSSSEDFLAALLGDSAGGLDFGQELQLQSLRNQGTTGAAAISAQASAAIARLQEAAETGRFLFGTETEARQAVQGLGAQLTAAINQILQNQGFSLPQLAGLIDPRKARLAAAEALREGTVFPTQARQELLANAAANPSDIVRLLSLQAGREPAPGSEEELSQQLAFNLPKTVREGRTAQQRLGKAFADQPGPSLDDLLRFALAAVKPEVDIGAQIQAAIDSALAAIGGGGGGGGGGGAPSVAAPRTAPPSAPRPSPRRPTATATVTPTPSPRRGTTATVTPARRTARPTTAQLGILADRFERATRFGSRARLTPILTDYRRFLSKFTVAELGRERTRLQRQFGSRFGRLITLLTSEINTRGRAAGRRRPGLQAKGGTHFEPGFFLIGEGKGGVKRGSAEFAFLAPGSVIAPMVKGERPTMDNARRAVAEMLIHGKRGNGNRKLVRAQGGVTVVSGDSLWKIIARMGGDPTRWPEVAKAIGLADPRFLQIGTVIPFEVLGRVGARVPQPPAPAPAPSQPRPQPSRPAPRPAARPQAAAPRRQTPEESGLEKTVGGIETLLGGPIGDLLREGRSLSEILQGFTLAPKPGDDNSEVFRQLVAGLPKGIRDLINAPGTAFPLQTFENLSPAVQEATSSALGTVSGDPNILQAILGLQRGLRRKAFSGQTRIALTR